MTGSGGVLAIVEQREGWLPGSAREVVSAAADLARELGRGLHAMVVGAPGLEVAARSVGEAGAHSVTAVIHASLGAYHPDGYPEAIDPLLRAGGYRVIVLIASDQGKDLAPRLAARLGAPLLQDVVALSVQDSKLVATRPVFAGKALARVRAETEPVVVTLRPSAFLPGGGGGPAVVETVIPALEPESWPTQIQSFRPAADDRPDLAEASVVVSGGRGMKGPENWALLDELRRSLGPEATLGASRAVVDAGWRPHLEQVGQTGRTVSPRLYFAIGISGAIQHLAGMKTAGTIVAVNKDPDAPIFKVADYGIVGDAFEILPPLSAAIRALRSGDGPESGPTP